MTPRSRQWFLLGMLPGCVLISYLNYDATGMQGMMPYYEEFKRTILRGFQSAAEGPPTLTFPMWGYGWLLLLVESKTALLTLQHALALSSLWLFFHVVESGNHLSGNALRLLKLAIVLSLPWYAFHSLLWPYSIATSLFIASSALLIASRGRPSPALVASALLFGLTLNFRSDYIWMPALAVVFFLISRRNIKEAAVSATVWGVAAYATLLPWAFYTKAATGHYLLTSTNSGHVLFIGLGNLPDNKWGITPLDSDPLMRRIVDEQVGVAYPTYDHTADEVLKREFAARVIGDPGEYLHRLGYVSLKLVFGGVYGGEFYQAAQCRPRCEEQYYAWRNALMSQPQRLLMLLDDLGYRGILLLVSVVTGRIVVLISFVMLPFVLIHSVRAQSPLLLWVCLGVSYQAAINVFAFNMPGYTGNMYLFHLTNMCAGVVWLYSWRSRTTANVV